MTRRGAHAAGQVRGRRRGRRALLPVALVAALVAGSTAAYAAFTDRGPTAITVSAGAVDLTWGGGGADQLAVPVTGLRPGDATVRLIDLANTGTVAASELQLTFGGAPVASASDGIQLALDRCSVAWTGAPGTAVCSGTVTPVVADRPATGRAPVPGSPALAVGGRDHLRLTVRLPASAPPAAQGATGSVTLRVDGNQRPGTQR